MGAYTVYTAHQATIPPPPPLPILRPLRRYSFSQCFIDPERCFVCINKLENLPRTHTQTDRQTDREFNYRGRSYPLWIVGGSGPIEKVSTVTGGDKGEVRYCFKCGLEDHITKDCKKTGPLKCVAHPEATSHKNQACWIWRKANNLPVTTINRSSSKDREKKTPPPPGGAGSGGPPPC